MIAEEILEETLEAILLPTLVTETTVIATKAVVAVDITIGVVSKLIFSFYIIVI